MIILRSLESAWWTSY